MERDLDFEALFIEALRLAGPARRRMLEQLMRLPRFQKRTRSEGVAQASATVH